MSFDSMVFSILEECRQELNLEEILLKLESKPSNIKSFEIVPNYMLYHFLEISDN